jgi:hypothetical protein
MFLFQYFFFEAVKEIKIWDQIWENWKVVWHERENKNLDPQSLAELPNYYSVWSGSLKKWAYDLQLASRTEIVTLSWMTDVSWMKKLEFWDLDKKMQIKISVEFIKLFFWIWFFVLLPLHFLVYFFLWRWIFYLYEKFWFRIFKNIYLNTFLSYFVIYFLQIYYWFSFIELAFWEFMGIMFYPILFITVQWIFLGISFDVIKEYNAKYPEKKVDALWIFALNVVWVWCYFVGFYIYNNFF